MKHFISRLTRSPHWLIVLFLAIVVVILRGSSFYQSVIDWDESLYLLVADRWLQGEPPYTTIWDNKPPGIYALFALALISFGHSVIAIRILACLFVIATCYGLFLLGTALGGSDRRVGLLAGILYAIASASGAGLSSNTELFLIPCAVFAVYLVWVHLPDLAALQSRQYQSRQYLVAFAAGLSLGLGFLIKPVIVFDFTAILILLGWRVLTQTSPLPQTSSPQQLRQRSIGFFKVSLLLGIGCILPTLITAFYFLSIDNFDAYSYANFTANRLRTIDNPFSWRIIPAAIDRAFRLSYLSAAIYLCCIPSLFYLYRLRQLPTAARVGLIWLLTIFGGICLVFRDLHFHYFLQLNPPLCLLGAIVIGEYLEKNRERSDRGRSPLTPLNKGGTDSEIQSPPYQGGSRGIGFPVALITIVALGQVIANLYANAEHLFFNHIQSIPHWNDRPAQVAAYLRDRIDRQTLIYVVDEQPIIYFLTDARLPTRYVLPTFLIPYPELPNITGVNALAELANIMAQKPRYVIRRTRGRELNAPNNRRFYQHLNRELRRFYRLETSIGRTDIYRRK